MRPIDADALYDALYDNEFQTFCPLDEVSDVIAAAPTLDYAPVVHGEWGEYEMPYGFPSLSGFPCSVCGMHQTDIRGLYYCPNCGAKMDGGKKL